MGRSTIRRITLLLVALAAFSCSDDDWPKTTCVQIHTQDDVIGRDMVVSYRRDYQYARYRFFDVGRVGSDSLFESGDALVRFELYELVNSADSLFGRGGIAFEDVRSPDSFQMISPVYGRFEPLGLAGSEWILVVDDPSRDFPYLKFIAPVIGIETKTIAYFMEINRNGTRIAFGNIEGDSLQLQLLKVSNPSPDDPFWDVAWKNVYDLGIRYIDYNEFDLDIFKGQPGDEANPANMNHQNSVPYLQILGLDRITTSGAPGADGRIDNDPAVLDLWLGLVIFPDRRPFDSDTTYSPNAAFWDSTLHDRVPAIYETDNYLELQKKTTYYFRSAYYEQAGTLYVGHRNLVPESEFITFYGHRLTKGKDYLMDYELGFVTFLEVGYYYVSKDVRICYDYVD